MDFSPVTCVFLTFGRININKMRAAVGRVPQQVLEVRAKKRTGVHSLVTALRNALHAHYPDKSLALGGTFVIQKGKAKIHIMVKAKALSENH